MVGFSAFVLAKKHNLLLSCNNNYLFCYLLFPLMNPEFYYPSSEFVVDFYSYVLGWF